MSARGRIGTATGILAMAAALGAATPAMAAGGTDEVRVGVMDLKADSLTYDASRVSIEYRAFTPEGAKEARMAEATGDDHGAVVASAFVRQYRSMDAKTPIRIFAGNPFALVKRPDGRQVLKLDFDRGAQVLEWMHGNGVRIVVTAFNSPDAAGAARFMDKAESLGMIVFSAYANSTGQGKVFPAGDERSVSVVDTSAGKIGFDLIAGSGRQYDGVNAGVTFGMNGGVPQGAYGAARMTGSSFASPKAAAYAAYVLKHSPGMDRKDVVAAMNKATRPMSTSRDGDMRSIAYIGDAATDEVFRNSLRVQTADVSAVKDVEMLKVMMADSRSR